MKKLFVLCFLFIGCSYSPHYNVVRDAYNTHAPVYAPTYAPSESNTTYSYPSSTTIYGNPKKMKKAKRFKIERIDP